MESLKGRGAAELQGELGSLVYRNPEGGSWETADRYLSGNVRAKLAVARVTERAERLKKERVDPAADNMLKITGEGRKAALDMRLIDPSAEPETESKVDRAVSRIFRIWSGLIPNVRRSSSFVTYRRPIRRDSTFTTTSVRSSSKPAYQAPRSDSSMTPKRTQPRSCCSML
jgi:hypothetical protein